MRYWIAVLAWCGWAGAVAGEGVEGPLLIKGVALGPEQVFFAASDQLWAVPLTGGTAQALSDARFADMYPVADPAGQRLAFCRAESGRGDVHILDLRTGESRQLTYHPGLDWPLAFSPDGERLLFASQRDKGPVTRLYQMDADGVWPEALAVPFGYEGAWSPDGAQLVYVPVSIRPQFNAWRYYRGGLRARLTLLDPDTGAVRLLTEAASNAYHPQWTERGLYFVSDRDGTANLFRQPTVGAPAQQLTHFVGHGIDALAGRAEEVVFARHGHLYRLGADDRYHPIEMQVPLDFSLRRERRVNALGQVVGAVLGGGEGAVVEARGEVFVWDIAQGGGRNLTQTSGVAERQPVLSPQGNRVAYFSDQEGGYQLHVRPLDGGTVQVYPIEAEPGFYQEPAWSPDGGSIAFSDHRLRLWVADLASGAVRVVDQSPAAGQNEYRPAWSPDGRFLAYQKRQQGRLPGVWVYAVEEGRSQRVSRAGLDARSPVFDAGGRYLYYIASPNGTASDFKWGVLGGRLLQSGYVGRLHAVVLRAGDPPPLWPALRQPNLDIDWAQEAGPVVIDWAGLEDRTLSVFLPHQGLSRLYAGPAGRLYAAVQEWPVNPILGSRPRQGIYRYDFRQPTKFEPLLHAADQLSVGADGRRILYASEGSWGLVRLDSGRVEKKRTGLPPLPMLLEAAAEWAQIYRESWRFLREHFYDPGFHGYDIGTLEAEYRRYLPNITSRRDLSLLLQRMIGHTSVSHSGAGGGDPGRGLARRTGVGLLGADYEIDQGRYRIARIYRLGVFDVQDTLRYAPLDQPGAQVRAGEYLLAVDGREITTERNLYAYFRAKDRRVVQVRVGSDPSGAGSRVVHVRTLSGEGELRLAGWAEANRLLVEEMSGGQLQYVHIAGWNGRGYERALQALLGMGDRRGVVIDQRFNGGGTTPDALIEMLRRRPLYAYALRRGDDIAVPVHSFAGSHVLLANQWCASAAETFALMFQLGKVGPVVGQPTRGAGIGSYAFGLRLIDGGGIRVPNRGAYRPDGDWGIENQGVQPDAAVPVAVVDWRAGRDRQLEEAVRLGLVGDRYEADFRHPPFPRHPGRTDSRSTE